MATSRRDVLLGMASLLAGMALPGRVLGHGDHAQATSRLARQQLGTSAAFDRLGRLWVAHTEPVPAAGDGPALSNIVLAWSADAGRSWTRTPAMLAAPEAVEANGEGRPKIMFGAGDEVFVSFTSALGKPHTGYIRFARSLDGGRTFSTPVTVQRDLAITGHRFDSMIVDAEGRIFLAWIDKRDLDAARAGGRAYRGAAVYYAVSTDQGASFGPDVKLADHCCECCRIALALNPRGEVVATWRHIFAPNVRDHAMANLAVAGKPGVVQRVSDENWRIDACPHHGPSLAYDSAGRRHQVWFSAAGEGSGLFYAAVAPGSNKVEAVQLGGVRAEHGEVVANGQAISIVWKEFDGETTRVIVRWSANGGASWQEHPLAASSAASDHPHLASDGRAHWLVWHTASDGIVVRKVGEKS